MPQFEINGRVTEDGQKALDWIEAQIAEAGDNVEQLNALPGHVKHYMIHVHKLGSMTEAQWLRDYAPTGAQAAYDRAMELEEADRHEAQANSLADELARLRETVEAQAAEIAALRETRESKPKRTRKAEPVEETEAAADDAEAD